MFRVINLKKIKLDKHFRNDLNSVSLNEEGKHIFVDEFQNVLNSEIEHKTLKRLVRMRELFKFEGHKLIKHLIGEQREFQPFSMLEKR